MFSTPWMFAGIWILVALVTVSLMYALGTVTGIFGGGGGDEFGNTGMIGGGLGGPFAVLLGSVVALRRRSFSLPILVHYVVVFVASVLAILFGLFLTVLMWALLTFGLVFVESVPSWGVVWAGLGALVGGAALFAGAYLQRGQVGKWTFVLLVVWLVVGAGLHVPLTLPDFHLFADLSTGSAGVMFLVFAAARPLYNQDSIREGWRARLRYYAGAFLFTMGTIGMFFLGEGLMAWIVG